MNRNVKYESLWSLGKYCECDEQSSSRLQAQIKPRKTIFRSIRTSVSDSALSRDDFKWSVSWKIGEKKKEDRLSIGRIYSPWDEVGRPVCIVEEIARFSRASENTTPLSDFHKSVHVSKIYNVPNRVHWPVSCEIYHNTKRHNFKKFCL